MIDAKTLSSLILSDVSLRLVEPHIYSVYSEGEHTNTYDKSRAFYDLVMGNRYYNRIMWGYRIEDFASFCHEGLVSSVDGWALDAGCGSLIFTARTYANYSDRPIVLLDESIQMLKAAKSRLVKLNGSVPPNIVFLHGDVLQLPFKHKSFHTIVSMNVLHVLKDEKRVLLEFRNALADEGTLYLTTLVVNNRFGDKYLNLLSRTGQLIPRTSDQILATFNELEMPIKYHIHGNMIFIYSQSTML